MTRAKYRRWRCRQGVHRWFAFRWIINKPDSPIYHACADCRIWGKPSAANSANTQPPPMGR